MRSDASGIAITATRRSGSNFRCVAGHEVKDRLVRLLARVPDGVIKAQGFCCFPPGDWHCTGVPLEPGDRATALVLAFDPIASSAPQPPLPARLWMRVSAGGTTICSAGNTHSLVSPRAGMLEAAVQLSPPSHGRPVAPPDRTPEGPSSPAVLVVAIAWAGSALRGLRYLASAGDVHGLVRDEINRLCNPAGHAGRGSTVPKLRYP